MARRPTIADEVQRILKQDGGWMTIGQITQIIKGMTPEEYKALDHRERTRLSRSIRLSLRRLYKEGQVDRAAYWGWSWIWRAL